MILAGDIGGTKVQVALFEPGGGRTEPVASGAYASADHDSLESILEIFLGKHPADVTSAAFGVAGPVVDGVSRITNLPWSIHETTLADRLGTPRVRLVNDLAATAEGLAVLRPDELEILQKGSGQSWGNLAIIAAGTGLGEATVVADRDRRIPLSSEGGHADFAPRDDVELDIWRWLRQQHPRVEYEMVVSGPGLVNLYRFFHRDDPHPTPWEDEKAAAAAVSRAAMEGACLACRASLERFVTIYGAEAGNLALKVLATGGVYIAGGIAPKILPVLRDGRFTEAFNSKGDFSDLMRSIAVRVVLNPETALLGAARVAADLTSSD